MDAISSGSVIRCPRGILEVMARSSASGSANLTNHFSYCGVITSAGMMALTRMPYADSSTAHSVVRSKMAPSLLRHIPRCHPGL